MSIKTYIILAQILIVINSNGFGNAKPMIGDRIRYESDRERKPIVSIKQIHFGNVEVEKDHLATGVLISRRDVLTVGHLLIHTRRQGFEVLIGTTDLRNAIKFYPYWSLHYENWKIIYQEPSLIEINDLGIIRLTRSVPEWIVPTTLTAMSYSDLYNLEVSVSSWGRQANGNNTRHLQTTEVKILSNTACVERVKLLRGINVEIPLNIVCSIGMPYAVMAPGDGGAPLFYNNSLVAIHKATCLYPNEPLNPNRINLHMAIDFYRNFISHVMGIP